jgi:LysM repeat protein
LSDQNEESLNRVPENLDSASLASYVSLESEILVASNITESRDTLLIQETVAPIQADIVDKPQNTVVGGSSREIKEYISVEGDTIQSVADNFAVSADTIRWANEISGDSLNVGTKLKNSTSYGSCGGC